jgi:zinc finger-containing ubiquitin peptidase 1
MPLSLRLQLEHGAPVSIGTEIGADGRIVRVKRVANEIAGIIPVLARLCGADASLSKVFLCHPCTKHIFKMQREGGFCGYRNIQMLVSFLKGTNFPGSGFFPEGTPSIFELQDMIEDAWDRGYDSLARIQTGGIIGTRKYIGTPEVGANFCCRPQLLTSVRPRRCSIALGLGRCLLA